MRLNTPTRLCCLLTEGKELPICKEKRFNTFVSNLCFSFGGDEGGRTPYLLNAIQALYQLSYTPKRLFVIRVAPVELHPQGKKYFRLFVVGCQSISAKVDILALNIEFQGDV